MRKIIWNKLAREDYFHIIDYLLSHWSQNEVQNFVDETNRILDILDQGNVDVQKTNIPQIRRCVLRPQITLFYKTDNSHTVELLRFWSNFQDQQQMEI